VKNSQHKGGKLEKQKKFHPNTWNLYNPISGTLQEKRWSFLSTLADWTVWKTTTLCKMDISTNYCGISITAGFQWLNAQSFFRRKGLIHAKPVKSKQYLFEKRTEA